MKLKLLVPIIIFAIILLSCTKKENFKVAISASNRMPEFVKLEKLNQKYIEKVGKKFKIKLIADRKFLFTTNYKYLKDSTFEMAVISNSNYSLKDSTDKNNSNIRSVLPINSRILYIAYNKEKTTPTSIENLFLNRNVAILSNETVLIKKILSDFGVNTSKVNFLKSKLNLFDNDSNQLDKHTIDSISKVDYMNFYKNNLPIPYDIEVGFISNNFTSNSRLHKLLNNRDEFVLYSLDDFHLYKNGSKAEGFCLRNKYFTPFLLPKGAFGEYPETPIITIREDFILAALSDVDDTFIYDFVKNSIEETDLIDMTTYGANFDNISFAFPLHEGTKRYLDKNAPTFFDKYSDLMGKIGAGIGGFYTGMMGFLLWRKKRRRRTIIKDMEKVLNIQSKLNDENKPEDLEKMYKELQAIQQEYHMKMIDHKILVDETLQIFFDLIDKIELIIKNDLKKLK